MRAVQIRSDQPRNADFDRGAYRERDLVERLVGRAHSPSGMP